MPGTAGAAAPGRNHAGLGLQAGAGEPGSGSALPAGAPNAAGYVLSVMGRILGECGQGLIHCVAWLRQ